MAVGDIIEADDFVTLRSRILNIMGTGSGTSGYGQSLSSSNVSAGDVITAQDVSNLYNDIARARLHQINSVDVSVTVPSVGDLVLDQTRADLDNLLSAVETDKLLISIPAQSTVETAETSSRSNWNGVISHVVRFSWPNSDARRHFFNSGGELRTSANVSGGSGSKTENWRSMLSNSGTVRMNYTQTTSTGSGSGSNTGFYDLSGSYQTIFSKTGSGVYAENDYIVQARTLSSTTVDIRIYFRDDDSGDPNIDENVGGTLTSTVSILRASGSNVSVPSPSSTNTSSL